MIRASDKATKVLSDELGVHYDTVDKVRRGINWKHVA